MYLYLYANEENPLWLGVDMLDLLLNFTRQNSGIIAKCFDDHAVVFISGWYKTEGDSLYIG